MAWVITLSLTGYPLVSAFTGLTGIENRPVSIMMRAGLVALSLWCLIRYFRLTVNKSLGKFWFAWWVFWCLYLVRLWLDWSLDLPSLKAPPVEYVSFAVGATLLPAIASVQGDISKTLNAALPWVIVTLAVACATNIYLLFFNASSADPLASLISFRLETETLNPTALSQLGVSLIILVAWVAKESVGIALLSRVVLIVFAGVGFAAVIAGGSRGPAVALAVTLVAYLLLRPKVFLTTGTALIVTVIGFVLATSADFLSDTVLLTRVADQLFDDSERAALFDAAWAAVLRHPFLGNGIEPLWIYPHNLVIESFLSVGVVGGFAFTFVFLFSLGQIPKISRNEPRFLWVGLLLLQYALAALVTGSIYMSSAFWILAAIVAVLGAATRVTSNNGISSPEFLTAPPLLK